jgi:hypothetical protein
MEPAALLTGVGEDVTQRSPKPQRTVTDRQHRRAHAAPFAIAQQIRPRFGGLPVPVGERDQLFAAVGAHPDQHQQTQPGPL